MSKEGKLILFFCVSILAFYLTRKLFIVLGLTIIGEVATYLFLAVVGLIGINILIPKEYRAWANLLPILCALIFSVMSIKDGIESYEDNKEAKREKIRSQYYTILTESLPDETKKEIIQELFRYQNQETTVKRPPAKPRKKSSSEKPGDRVYILPGQMPGKNVQKKITWGKDIATSTFPEVVNSWSRFAQEEGQKAMQRAANQGNRVKIE